MMILQYNLCTYLINFESNCEYPKEIRYDFIFIKNYNLLFSNIIIIINE